MIANQEDLLNQPKIATHLPSEIEKTISSFFRHLNHELKRPLASLQQSIYLLLEEIQGPLTAGQRRILEIQLMSAESISNCISNLADLSQIEAGIAKYQLGYQDLVPLVKDVLERYESQSRQRKIEVKIDLPQTPLVVECDKERLGRAMGLVIENALKFSNPGGAIKIRVEYVPKVSSLSRSISLSEISQSATDRGFVVVTIADTGPGIPESQREVIFQKFYQIRKDDESYQRGIGIGLTLCRSILSAHQGAIWEEDSPAGGAQFSILLPLADTKAYHVSRSS
jgi:signal transduction histidine kinase